MIEIPDPIKATINTIIFSLPVIATLLLALNEIKTKKRKLNTLQSTAVLLVFWGFLLFASWENLQIPIGDKYSYSSWLMGWLIPLLIGLIFTIIAVVVGKKEPTKQ